MFVCCGIDGLIIEERLEKVRAPKFLLGFCSFCVNAQMKDVMVVATIEL